MSWWWPRAPHRTDDEITAYVDREVKEGRVAAANAQRLEQLLRDEADGKAYIPRDPQNKPKLPRTPSWEG
ncbi:hypothetical protein [Bradyrhizobium sp. I1.7.5]|uniref:hypothetical protein n=1 Tax=Bradyrhizobium sp. I1.7.5 TaxID=3156363 RepID=UPI0033943C24